MKTPVILALAMCAIGHASVTITVEADSGRKAISPYIYGKNGVLSDDSLHPTSDSILTIYKDGGLHMMRSNGGNNASKYNWARRLSSHPDWYNNVYGANWDYVAKTIQTKLPEISGMFAFQLTGWAASNTNNNFNDWGYNQSNYWAGVGQNLAGGGTPSTTGVNGNMGQTDHPGDINKYLMPWPADSTAGILPYWFGPGGLGLDSNRFRYWNMDNEVEIWDGTHDDIYPARITAEDFIQKYVKVALAVRAHYPGIKLVAPVSPAEWQWYTWNGGLVSYKGKSVSWPEFFIWRLSEVEDSTGVRMLDVYDVHFYPGSKTQEYVVQQHRVWFDTTYIFPQANGVRFAEGNWNGSQQKEYFFERINRWLEKYFGPNHGIGLGVSESAIMCDNLDANVAAVWHASFLGTFADHGVEFFTPWSWEVGQWEATHLFSKKGHDIRVLSRSSLDSLVSAYSSISKAGDSLTIILVNRDLSNSQNVNVNWNGFTVSGSGTRLQLSGLGTQETFVSESKNALQSSTVNATGSSLNLTLPSKSVTALLFKGKGASVFSSSSTASSSSAASSSSLVSSSSHMSSSSALVSSSLASSSSDSPTSTLAEKASRLIVRNTPHGLLVEGTDGSEHLQIFDTQGQLLASFHASQGSTLLDGKMHAICFLRIQKGNQVQWHFVPQL